MVLRKALFSLPALVFGIAAAGGCQTTHVTPCKSDDVDTVDAGGDGGDGGDGATDASVEAAVESGTADAGPEAQVPQVCAPLADQPWTAPTVNPRLPPGQGKCTSGEVTAWANECSDHTTAGQAKCDTWWKANGASACGRCLITPESDPMWGPLYQSIDASGSASSEGGALAFKNTYTFAVWACLEATAAGCGVAYGAFIDCANAACSSDWCPLEDERQQCITDSMSAVCRNEVQQLRSKCSAALAEGAPGEACFSNENESASDWLKRQGMTVCGSAPGDAGTGD